MSDDNGNPLHTTWNQRHYDDLKRLQMEKIQLCAKLDKLLRVVDVYEKALTSIRYGDSIDFKIDAGTALNKAYEILRELSSNKESGE